MKVPFQRIMIFGLPGSGKSTFAIQLAKELKLPLYHLDKHFFIHKWIERDKEEFAEIHQKILNSKKWIIDGNALSFLEPRYARAELVLYFCASHPLCFGRLIKRRFFKDRSIQDRALNCPERLRYPLVKYMWTFNKRVQPLIQRLSKTYPTIPLYTIKSPQDLNRALKLILRT